MALRTKLCDLLGIDYPILQAGMGNSAYADLVVAVSQAGGLGTLGTGLLNPDEVREEVRKAKRRLAKPFGIDITFHPRDVDDTASVPLPEKPPEPVLQLREELKAKGVDLDAAHPRTHTPEFQKQKFAIALEEGVPILVLGRSTPEWVVKEAHAHGMVVLSIVGTVRHAQRAEANGADAIIAQGHEAGGHTGLITTMVLVPQVVRAVNVPVVAAGGIFNGQGLAAALALGAVGVWVGTRFLATPEAGIPPEYKQLLVQASEGGLAWDKVYDGHGHYHLRNRVTEVWQGHEQEVLPAPQQGLLMGPLLRAAVAHNAIQYMNVAAGQAGAAVTEIKPAGDIVREMAAEAEDILKRLTSRVLVG